MKVISLIFVMLFLGKSCDSQIQKDIANTVIEYTSDTRGFHLKISVANHKVSVSQGRGTNNPTTETVLSDEDWNEVTRYFQEVDLEKLADYKDPTQKRFYDGAGIAKLKIRYQDKDYETVNFDHGFPPKEIEKLVNKIVSLIKEKE